MCLKKKVQTTFYHYNTDAVREYENKLTLRKLIGPSSQRWLNGPIENKIITPKKADNLHVK